MADARITVSAVDKASGPLGALRQRMAGLSTEAQALDTRFGGLGATIAGALTLGGITAFVNGVAHSLDRLNDLKDATGASIGNLSALEDVAARTGTSFEGVEASLLKLNKALQDARPGDDVSQVLERIGLDAAKLRDEDPAQALQDVAKALNQFADDGNKARAVQVLFGRSLREVAPFLKDLADAGQLNATVTDEQAANAEKFANRLAASTKNMEDLGRAIASAVLPGVLALQEAFATGGAAGEKFAGVATAVKTAFEAVAVLGANVAFVFKAIGREAGAIAAQIAALARGDITGFTAISDAVKEDGVRAREELDDLEKRIMNVRDAGAGRGIVNPALAASAPSLGVVGGKQVQAAVSEFDKYIQRLQDAQVATLELSAVEQARLDITLGKLGELTTAQEAQVLSLAEGLDALRAKDADAAARDEALLQRRQDVLDTLALAADSTSARFDALAAKQDEVFAQFQAGLIGPQDYARAMQVLGERMDALVPKLDKLEEKTDEFSKQAARNIQDALGESTLRILEGKFGDIGKLWGDLLKKMIAQAAAANLAKYLLGDNFGKTGQVGGVVGDFWGWLTSTGSARAAGGPVQAGKPYLVGEKGPELVVPQQAATVMPAGSFGGGNTFQVIVQGDASENTLRLINQGLAQFEARLSRRGA